MKKATLAALAAISTASSVSAGGLDRSGQNINILFEDGNYAEVALGYVAPSIDGNDRFTNAASGDVGTNFFQGSLGYKQQVNDQLSFALIIDQPYGADINYGLGGSGLLGGTGAVLDSRSITGLARYKFNDRFSVHGGIRAQSIDASITLQGAGYGALSGYSASLSSDTEVGFQLGVAYEIPEIALRIAATYFSEIDHDFATVENFAPGVVSNTTVTTPEAINLTFQTGIAADTLLFGSFRYADYSVVKVTPPTFGALTGGASLTTIDRARDFSIGIGRRFNDKFSGSIALNYSAGGSDDLVSPLAPSDGSYGVTIGGSYQVTEAVKITGGINYTRLGDAIPTVAGVQLADFNDNDVVGVGLRLGYSF